MSTGTVVDKQVENIIYFNLRYSELIRHDPILILYGYNQAFDTVYASDCAYLAHLIALTPERPRYNLKL